ncbi:DtxR family transcriptional regulator [Tepiditoga spiralis]|uniref:DtxR family transcriptional regulator n=1 Tax=Tepiditoga spiralis TaxID=2108365 RepID=A0A7G1G5M9_9BACT|nr:DtxR family transcriptional regulator [Tepiditoga spiralis]BBE31425.1 DtxR family transcriptional regulator [Tepiditoga spiralis]
MVLSESSENYLIAIYEKELNENITRIKDLTKILKVKHSSVIEAIKKLKLAEYVNYEKRGYIKLTQKGICKAQNIYKNRVAIRSFLINVLNLDPVEAQDISCKMEHFKSKKLIKTMESLEHFFDENKQIKKQYIDFTIKWLRNISEVNLTLEQIKIGNKVKVVEVIGDEATKKKLMVMGITSGVEIEVKEIAPLGDPIKLKVRGYNLSLRKSEAKNIIVSK